MSTKTKKGQYNFQTIEAKWRSHWKQEKTYQTLGPGDPGFDDNKPKCYILDMFPYPSGAGLHIGHPKGYIASDIYSRYKRMQGFNVLHPMGFDSFGLPAEQYAIEHNIHPATVTEQNIDAMRDQLQFLGLSFDWTREVVTSQASYYRWTQWIFAQLFDSYFDEDETWEDGNGRRIKGRAKPIADLEAQFAAGRALSVTDRQGLGTDETDLVGTNHRRAPNRAEQLPAGVPARGRRQLVPWLGHCVGQRGGNQRRPQRARRFPCVSQIVAAMDDAHNILRRAAHRGLGL